jgi:hypothetical protein
MDPTVYDHLRSTDPDDDASIYRVVGTATDTVTLLRVSDGDGRRAHTGEVITIPRTALDTFETAENPDGNRSVAATLRSAGASVYWSLRTFVASLAARPFLSALGVALFLAGALGSGRLPLPDDLLLVVELGGLLLLVLVGNGRI